MPRRWTIVIFGTILTIFRYCIVNTVIPFLVITTAWEWKYAAGLAILTIWIFAITILSATAAGTVCKSTRVHPINNIIPHIPVQVPVAAIVAYWIPAYPPPCLYVQVPCAYVLHGCAISVAAVLPYVPVGVPAAVAALPLGAECPVGVVVGNNP